MRTDELRELLERYPDLDRRELRRLRQLYHDASATDVIAIMSSAELAPKAERLDLPSDLTWDLALIAAAILVAGLLTVYLLVQSGWV